MRIKLLVSCGILFLSVCTANAQKKLITFGLWADCQYADIKDTPERSSRSSKERLAKAIEEFNRLRLPFAVSLGDIIDRGHYYSFTQIDSVLSRADSAVYHVAGNHDFSSDSINADNLFRSLGLLAKSYYSIRRNGVRLVFLNSNELTLYSTCFDQEGREAAIQYRDSLASANTQIYDYNGSVSPAQIQWLENELYQAQTAKEIVIVFSHHPLCHILALATAQNAHQVRSLLERYPCVKAHISGHLHIGGYAQHKGIHYLIHKGMLQKKVENYFSKITIFDDRIEVEGNAGARRVMIY